MRWSVRLMTCAAILVMALPAAWATEASAASGWTAYVSGNNSVTPINTATNTPGTPIPVGNGPEGVAITPDGKTAYVADFSSGAVTPIDTATNTAGTAIPAGSQREDAAINPGGTTAYFSGNGVTPINTTTDTAGTAFLVGMSGGAVAISPDGTTAWVADYVSTTVTPVDLATGAAGTPISVGANPDGIAITPNGKTLYVADFGSGTVTPIDTATETAGTPITVGTNPLWVTITPDGKTVYVTNSGSKSVTPITVATNTAGTPITVGTTPTQAAITPDGKFLYVANQGSASVTPITIATNTAGTAIPVGTAGGGPVGVAITPDQAPTASFSSVAEPAGLASSFDGSASSSPVGSIASYQWDFGDGQTTVTTAPTDDPRLRPGRRLHRSPDRHQHRRHVHDPGVHRSDGEQQRRALGDHHARACHRLGTGGGDHAADDHADAACTVCSGALETPRNSAQRVDCRPARSPQMRQADGR